MTDTTIAKIISKDLKVVAYHRYIPATEYTTASNIYRLTDFTDYPHDEEFTNEDDLTAAFINHVAAYAPKRDN